MNLAASEYSRSEFSKNRWLSTVQEKAYNDEELDEEFPRVLDSLNAIPSAAVVFSFQERTFIPQTIIVPPSKNLLCGVTNCLLKSAPDAFQEETIELTKLKTELRTIVERKEVRKTDDENDGEPLELHDTPNGQAKHVSAFTLCERAAQTTQQVVRTSSSETSPPKQSQLLFQVSLSSIYDAYTTRIQNEDEQRADKQTRKRQKIKDRRTSMSANASADRVVCQNVFNDVAFDFRYYEDPADAYRPDGSLLPLWILDSVKDLGQVTDLHWNWNYLDLLVVTYARETVHSDSGALVLLSFKNPSHPEFLRLTPSSALSCATHPKYSYLIAVGLRDGNVFIYDTSSSNVPPLYSSEISTKHKRGVSMVVWEQSNEEFPLSLFSMSLDGVIISCKFNSGKMVGTTVMVLPISKQIIGLPDNQYGLELAIPGGGVALCFHPNRPNVYLVGTKEGNILMCHTLQGSDCNFIYRAHNLPVVRIVYNPYNPRIFISCSLDGSVKVWEDERRDPLLSLFLGDAVIDVLWTPQTSTSFVCLTGNGSAHVYDVSISKSNAICQQRVLSLRNGNFPIRLAICSTVPVVAIADTEGAVHCMKLSPNLRMPAKQSKKDPLPLFELEAQKLNKVLALMKPLNLNEYVDKTFIEV